MQSANSSEVRKLQTGKTTDHQTPAGVQVEKNGLYCVAVFPISSERGIVE